MLSDLLQSITITLQGLVASGGTMAIVMVALLENLFPLTPSEFMYPLTGKMVFDGQLTVLQVLGGALLGTLIGATLWYALGYYLGEERTRQFFARYGTLQIARWKITLVSLEDYDKALELFRRRGGTVLVIGRIMPMVHGVVSIPAGVTRMPLIPFYLYSAVGTFAWVSVLVLGGYLLGSQWETVLGFMDTYQSLWYVAFGALIVYWIARRIHSNRLKKAKGLA
jgi:membrane protein DedA with SNARE-associated domain